MYPLTMCIILDHVRRIYGFKLAVQAGSRHLLTIWRLDNSLSSVQKVSVGLGGLCEGDIHTWVDIMMLVVPLILELYYICYLTS